MSPNFPGEHYFEQLIEGGAPLLKAAPLEEICAAAETARLLDEVAAFVRSYVVLDEHQADAVALSIAHTRSTRGTLALPGDLERRDAFGSQRSSSSWRWWWRDPGR
jgi:hypothetical protein